MSNHWKVLKTKKDDAIYGVVNVQKEYETLLRCLGHFLHVTPDEIGISGTNERIHVIVSGQVDTLGDWPKIDEVDVYGYDMPSAPGSNELPTGTHGFLNAIRSNQLVKKVRNDGIVDYIAYNKELGEIYNSPTGRMDEIRDNDKISAIVNGGQLNTIRTSDDTGTIYNFGKISELSVGIYDNVGTIKNAGSIDELNIRGTVHQFYSRTPTHEEIKILEKPFTEKIHHENIDGSLINSIKISEDGAILSWGNKYPFKVGEVQISEKAKVNERLLEYLMNTQEVAEMYKQNTAELSQKDRYTILNTPANELPNKDFEFLRK